MKNPGANSHIGDTHIDLVDLDNVLSSDSAKAFLSPPLEPTDYLLNDMSS